MRKTKKGHRHLKPSDPDIPAPAPGAERVGPAGRKNDRRCIASGASLCDRDPAIRFVLGPDGTPVPDLAGKLPGRGAWIAADQQLVEKALDKGLFSRAFKTKVAPPEAGTAEFVSHLQQALADRALNALGLARRAGALISGFEKTKSAVQKGTATAYIHANDASDDGVSRIVRVAAPHCAVWHPFAGEVLDMALGESNVVHLALTDAGMAGRFGREAARYLAYIGVVRDGAVGQTQEKSRE